MTRRNCPPPTRFMLFRRGQPRWTVGLVEAPTLAHALAGGVAVADWESAPAGGSPIEM